MKFTWFNLMPWPYLPDDFREKNRSVWVDIDQNLFDPAKSHEVYNTYMDLLEYAGTLGFDGIGVNEHHQNGYGIMPSPNIIAAGLARRTKDPAIVVLGNSGGGSLDDVIAQPIPDRFLTLIRQLEKDVLSSDAAPGARGKSD